MRSAARWSLAGGLAALSALALTACASTASPSAMPSTRGSPSAAPTSAASPTPSPEPLATAEPSDAAGAHVAAGLAFARFTATGSGMSELFVVDSDGTIQQLTGLEQSDARGASLPVWSPDRDALAFGPPKVGAGPARYLSVVSADGSDTRRIAALGDEFGVPFSWSPDGTSLLYFDVDAAAGPAMWLADVATGQVRSLGAGQLPRWLPDGRRISFQRAVEGRDPADAGALVGVIWVMSLTDGEITELAQVSDAAWSPDGTMVVLQHDGGELWLADADGSNPRPLARGFSPAWSPDGQHIVFGFQHDNDGVPLLTMIDRSGRIVWSGARGSAPSWSPDASRLAVEIAFPDPEIHVLDAGTGELLWEIDGMQPSWAP
jgi:Tol biopolymer transport system component